jgi:polyribonucleotide nucleotidyltransferase
LSSSGHEIRRTIAGRELVLRTGSIGRQAGGSVVAQVGETVVFAAICTAKAREDIDFFPLTIDYREFTSAAGKFPGGFFKREGRPTTKEILTMRQIDRPIRPMFAEGYRAEVQVAVQVWATDQENDPDIPAMIAAFAATHLSEAPFLGPMGAARIGHIGGKLVVNPTLSQLKSPDSRLELIVAATPEAITMVEAGAKEIDEATMVEALELGASAAREAALACDELRRKAGVPKLEVTPPAADGKLETQVRERFRDRLRAALRTPGKHARGTAVVALEKEAEAAFVPAAAEGTERVKLEKALRGALGDVEWEIEREEVLAGRRLDGRRHDEIRPIRIEVGLLPRVHGSALFTRGETQALVVTTLGTVDDEQRIDGLTEEYTKKFLLHYNFPPFSVGEVRPIRGPSRREIGHGALAERGIEAVLPEAARFPYTIRLVSNILESNGSSSMATVCGGSLSLMDAGVPIAKPVAGIAMGLVKDGDRVAILSDIQGSEDHNGDMDFKVAGTAEGITSLQMDIKVKGLTRDLLRRALEQARQGRLSILETMSAAIAAPRADISPHAPRIQQIRIKPEKIGALIGPQGRTVKALQEELHCKIEVVDDTGLVHVSAHGLERLKEALARIESITQEAEVGRVYQGTVKSVKEFGAFVEILPGVEGLLHVSEIAHERIERVSDVVKPGDRIEVKVVEVNEVNGKVRLSRRVLLQAPEGMPPREEVGAGGFQGGGFGGGDRGGGHGRRGGGPPRDRGRGGPGGPRR